MKNYEMTVEDGVITYIKDVDENGEHIEGILYIPKEARCFHPDAWMLLNCDAEGIVADEENPDFSSKHNCLLSKDGKTLIKTCKSSDVSRLSGIEVIGSDAFSDIGNEREEFIFTIPQGVKELEYRALATHARKVEIIVPASVCKIGSLAFMIYSDTTRITFEGDADIEIGAFATENEAKASDNEIYKMLPPLLYTKKERLTVSCIKDSNVYNYCKKYGITVEGK